MRWICFKASICICGTWTPMAFFVFEGSAQDGVSVLDDTGRDNPPPQEKPTPIPNTEFCRAHRLVRRKKLCMAAYSQDSEWLVQQSDERVLSRVR